jgi:phospholipase C
MATPIEHVVIIVKENHTFDNYFGRYPFPDAVTGAHVDGDGTLELSENPPAPMEDGVLEHGPWLHRDTTARRKQFTEQEIPMYFKYARQYTLCDHFFSEIAGPSGPNHLMLLAAQSPVINNPSDTQKKLFRTTPIFPSLPSLLDDKRPRLDWRMYSGYMYPWIKHDPLDPPDQHDRNVDNFVQDATNGDLPAVSWVYAPHEFSEHPPISLHQQQTGFGDVRKGSDWTGLQVDAVIGNPALRANTAIFVTWDDWGGWYDSIDPPSVETWTSDPVHPEWNPNPHPNVSASLAGVTTWTIDQPTQFRYGSRVPCLVISPYALKGHISKTLYSHVSIVRFCEKIFGLDNLNERDLHANDMLDCFDFSQNP